MLGITLGNMLGPRLTWRPLAPVDGRRYSQGMKIRRTVVRVEPLIDPPTPYGNFLYLLAEMEAAIERGTIRWSPETAQAARRRLGRLFIQLDAIATRPPVH
jgi:hypothetical protein